MMVSCLIRHVTNCTQHKMQLSRIVMFFAEPDYVKKVKTNDVLNYLGQNFLKSFKINVGSKGLILIILFLSIH